MIVLSLVYVNCTFVGPRAKIVANSTTTEAASIKTVVNANHHKILCWEPQIIKKA